MDRGTEGQLETDCDWHGGPTPSAAWRQRRPVRLPHRIVVHGLPDPAAEQAALREGLFAAQARIDPKHFYDPVGCALFSAICRLPEYYLTRTETAIFARRRREIADCLPRNAQWIDLGCGDGAKALPWVGAADARRYLAVDIAPDNLVTALDGMAAGRPRVERLGIVTDLSRPLRLEGLVAERENWPPVFFYPGSSLGNFTRPAALALLRDIRGHAGREGGLLIGVDLVKDEGVLRAAYDDAQGVTAAFNRNVLQVANRLLAADFDQTAFEHQADFDATESRIEMRLRARHRQVVRIDGELRHFAAGETILTEYSHKYTVDGFGRLLAAAGFGQFRAWTDERGWFGVFLARP